jgi:hypothetical protein
MSRWFRSYDDALDDPKVQRLPGELFKAWFNLMCVSSKNDGKPFSIEEIEFRLRLTPAKAKSVADKFVETGLLDPVGGRYISHNWDRRQYKSDVSNERVKLHRERKCNVTETVTVAPPETEQITDTEKKDCPKRVRTTYPEGFEKFWKAYPTTPIMSKKEAFKEYSRLPEDQQNAAFAAITGFKSWLASQKDHPVVHACRFLSQRRFEGFAGISTGHTLGFESRAGSPEWVAWRAHYVLTAKKFSIKYMDAKAEDGNPVVFPDQWPPGHEARAA